MWSWEVFLDYLFDPRVVRAAFTTLAVAAAAQAAATVIGFVVALGLRAGSVLPRVAGEAFVWLFRSTPPLLQLLLFYFGLPQLGVRPSVLEAGLICLSLYAAAYMAEVVRAALESVDRGQVESARAIGLSRAETMRSVVLPQALRVMLPPFGNEFSSMMRTTSLLSVISFEELLRVTTLVINETFRAFELYAVAACWYLAMTSAWLVVQAWLERRTTIEATARPAATPA